MYLIYTASKDTYITNKIVSTTSRATDANLGGASTIDLFKLYDENTISGESTPIELSRGLIKFNLLDISSSLSGLVDFSHSSFNAYLKLHDIQGLQVAPSNFNITLFPLAQAFDEGKGKDVAGLNYLDRANWVTASYTSDNVVWNTAGAFASGTLGDSSIDLLEDASIGGSDIYLVKSQKFNIGSEDLLMDVTNLVSASMTGILPNHGFLISYSGSQEHDSQSRFVKRFASRHTKNPYIRPKLIIQFNDSMTDNNSNFEFNVTGSLFLNNFSRGALSNILSGSANTEIAGENSLLLKLHTGSYEKYFTGSQHKTAGIFDTGIYSTSVIVDRFLSASVTSDSTINDFVVASGSITFGQEWLSLDENISFYTGSLTIGKSNSHNGAIAKKYRFSLSNLRSEYQTTDKPRIDVFITDLDKDQKSVRIPVRRSSELLENVYYRIRDSYNGQILTPFVEANNVTKMSSDSNGMFFTPSLSHLPPGRSYTIDIMTVINGIKRVYNDNGAFRMIKQ